MTLEEIRHCVRKTIDDCLVEVLAGRPAVHVSDRQHLRLAELVEELRELFFDIRCQNLT